MISDNKTLELVVLEKTTEHEFSGKMSTFILIILTLLYILNLMDQQAMAAALEMVKADLRLSDTQAGAVQSIFYFSTAIFAFLCAVLVDKWSRKKAIGLMALVWSQGTLATAMMSRFLPLAGIRFITGIGESGYPPASTTWLSKVFSWEKRARILGFYGMAIPIRIVLGILIGSELAMSTGS